MNELAKSTMWKHQQILLLLLLLKNWLQWCCHSYKLLQGHCRQSLIREWLQKKWLFELLPERGEWWCSSNVRWQGVPCPCSWHRECSITQRWTTRRRYDQHHGYSRTKTSSSIHITGQLQWLGAVCRLPVQCCAGTSRLARRAETGSSLEPSTHVLLLWWSVDVDDDDPSFLCTVVYPHVTVQSEVGGAATVADRTGDVSARWRMDTILAKMAILSLELLCFSPPSFEGHDSIVTGGTSGWTTNSQWLEFWCRDRTLFQNGMQWCSDVSLTIILDNCSLRVKMCS